MNDLTLKDAETYPDLVGKTVLLVEDEPINVAAMKRVFQRFRLHVLTALDGAEAVELLQKEDHGVDAVVMDTMMPVMDGLEATRRIRAMEHLADIPIISLTARAMAGDQEQCMAAGASAYFSKPVHDIDAVMTCLDELIRDRPTRD